MSSNRTLHCERGDHEYVIAGRGRAGKSCPEHRTVTEPTVNYGPKHNAEQTRELLRDQWDLWEQRVKEINERKERQYGEDL
jgi:hypothetical protein